MDTFLRYYIMDKRCHKCHPQCKICNGPTARDCTACLNVRIQQGKEWECMEECPKNHYFDGNSCIPCDASCYDFGFANYSYYLVD